MSSSIGASFLAALQASVAVLLTIFYGVLATQLNLLNENSAKEISRTCVRLFLPALLIYNIGSNLDASSVSRYAPVLAWAIIYNSLSMGMGIVSTKLFKFPTWVTPAIAFNNTTSLPLLLVQALEATDILKSLLMGPDDSMSDAVARAKSYFLVNAMVGNCLTFAVGPRLLNHEEDAPDAEKRDDDEHNQDHEANGNAGAEHEEHGPNERTSLLPEAIAQRNAHVANHLHSRGNAKIQSLPAWAQEAIDFLYSFVNAPMIGAIIGLIIGLVNPLHRTFFASSEEGGVLNAWLTKSIQNIGDLFAALQVIVVGVKLGAAMRRFKRGDASGAVPWGSVVFVTLIRYILWPAISIPVFYFTAKKTTLLGEDPILFFALMLCAAGPPAMKLTALADVNGSDEFEKMSIAKFLTISYIISPLICLPVVGSLKAAEAASA